MPSSHPEKRPVDPRDRYRALVDVSKAIVAHRNLTELFHDLAGRLHRVVGFDGLALVLHEAERNAMRIDVLEPADAIPDRSRLVFPLKGEPDAEVWRSQQPLILSNATELERLPRLAEVFGPFGINSICLLPLRTARWGWLGVLAFACERPSAYDMEGMEFLQAVANHVAVAVENASDFGHIDKVNKRLSQENAVLAEDFRAEHNFRDIIGRSSRMDEIRRRVKRVAPKDVTVLIRGERGTGKELIARDLHKLSGRDGKFMAVNCAAIPPHLQESELFGHEKGAFTDADRQKFGRFELAGRGTLFLDEVGDMSLDLQAKLLRVLQERKFERVGGSELLDVKVRVVAATNRDLEQMMDVDRFRRDLFDRLNVVPLLLPPLRDRTEDIPELVEYFNELFAQKHGERMRRIPEATMAALVKYNWPGNIRELQNVIENAVLFSLGPTLDVGDLGSAAQSPEIKGQKSEISGQRPESEDAAVTSDTRPPTSGRTLADAEREWILAALKETGWKQAAAAGSLGITRQMLQRKMKKLEISRPE